MKILKVESAAEVMDEKFFDEIKTKIISSKHSQHVEDLKKVGDIILKTIMNELGINYSEYTITRRLQLRNALIYIVAFNIKKYFLAK